VRDEFERLPMYGKAALAEAIGRRGRGASQQGEVRKLTDGKGLIELRVQVGHDPFRAVFFVASPVHDVCVLVVYKNQRQLPKSDIDLAAHRMKQWQEAGRERSRSGLA
jgi:phage-related protein